MECEAGKTREIIKGIHEQATYSVDKCRRTHLLPTLGDGVGRLFELSQSSGKGAGEDAHSVSAVIG